jgi:protein-tyrosine phosphatase
VSDVDWLTPSLAVGGCFPIETAERLAREHGIARIVDLRSEDRDEELELARHGIRLLHLPTEDQRAVSPEMLDEGVAWVREGLAAGQRVLIHCQHGIGRSALLAMCVLVQDGMPPIEAMSVAKDARAVVSPSPEQLKGFIEFTRRHRSVTGAAWPLPSFTALAAIAYRHLA